MFPPVIKIITLTIKNAPSITSKPITAKKNLCLAEAILFGSPREVIHWIPEIITMTRVRKLPKMIRLLTTVWKKAAPEVSSPPWRALGIPEGACKSWGPDEPPGTLNWASLVTSDIFRLGWPRLNRGCFAPLGCLSYIT